MRTSTMQCLDYTDLYRTAPLHDPGTQIRLLRAIQSEEEYLSYEFIVCKLADAPDYDAISYTWGDPTERGFIRVNNVPISVTENCRYALWQVRQLGSIHTWIDAVCINQHGLEEKGAQVATMFHIYKSASRVLACIGPPDEVSEHIRNVLIQFEAQFEFQAETDMEYVIQDEIARYWLEEHGETFCGALSQSCKQLSSRPYFSRLWIAQELYAGGPRSHVVFGAVTVTWNLLDALYGALIPSNFAKGLAGVQIACLNALFADASNQSGLPLEWISDFHCHDVRDRIYGTLAFSNWESAGISLLQPDYAKSPFELAVTVSSLILQNTNRGVNFLANLVQVLEITASDPRLRPYLSSHDMAPNEREDRRRKWEVTMNSRVRLDLVRQCCEKAKCDLSCGLKYVLVENQFEPPKRRQECGHCPMCKTTAEGWWAKDPKNREEYTVPLSTKIDDLIIVYQLGRIESSLVVREASDSETMSVIGQAYYTGGSFPNPQNIPCSSTPWSSAVVTMDASIGEMISILVPYDPSYAFRLPRIVSFRTYNWIPERQTRENVRDYTVLDLSK